MKKYLLVFMQIFSSTGLCFSLNSQTSSNFRGWASSEIQFQMNLSSCPAGVDVSGIMKDAIAIWNNVPESNLKLKVVGDTTSTTFSDPITVFCDTVYSVSGQPGAADSSPGYAQINPQTGDTITSGVMHLNASSGQANIANFSRDLVAAVLAHEIGHLIGLGHSQDVNALMYYDASLKTTLALAQDDIDAISYLYPRNEPSPDKIAGCALVKNFDPSPKGPGRGVLLVSILIPLLVYGFLRQKLRLT